MKVNRPFNFKLYFTSDCLLNTHIAVFAEIWKQAVDVRVVALEGTVKSSLSQISILKK